VHAPSIVVAASAAANAIFDLERANDISRQGSGNDTMTVVIDPLGLMPGKEIGKFVYSGMFLRDTTSWRAALTVELP
jgi:hypothetical protein